MTLTEEQTKFIHELRHRYQMHISDGWRCDFCESNCDCDEIYMDGLLDEYANRFHTTENLLTIQDMIFDY